MSNTTPLMFWTRMARTNRRTTSFKNTYSFSFTFLAKINRPGRKIFVGLALSAAIIKKGFQKFNMLTETAKTTLTPVNFLL